MTQQSSMKFDLIVGNPPYEGSGKPLYLQILAALIPFGKEVVWICPTQWTKAWKDIPYTEELKNTTLNCLIDHENMPSPFDEASIWQGVAVYHFGPAEKYESYEDLKYEKFKNVQLAKSIISKLEDHEHVSEHSCNSKGDYCVSCSYMRGHVDKSSEHSCNSKGDYCVSCSYMRGNVDKSSESFKWDWLTLMGEDWLEDFTLRTTTDSGKPLVYFLFNTEEEARNFRMSTETDIAMFALSVHKVNCMVKKRYFSLMPWLGDYTRSWNDDQIAAELGLTREELDYIHEEMKNFGWKCAKRTKK